MQEAKLFVSDTFAACLKDTRRNFCWGGQGIPGQDERKRSTRVMPPGGWDARPSATSVGNCRLGSLSTGSLVGRPGYEDGLMYSQARVMPGNAGDSPARVIETSEKQGSGSTGHTTKLG